MTYERIVTLDFETYFSQEYSLKSKALNTSEYVRHPEFKVQCVAIKIDDQPVGWYRDRDVAAAISSIDWSTSALLAHHAAFDGLILSHHYGVVPAYYLDTLSMARALHSNGIRAGLDEVARFYNVGNKLPDVLPRAKGLRDLPDDLMTSLGQYCALDVELCRTIYSKMSSGFPQAELDLIDLTVRMFCDPVLRIDIPRVEAALLKEQQDRMALINNSGVDLTTLSSSDKFANALRRFGVEPPTKISPRTGKTTWAFSKTDLDFIELRVHPDQRVRALAAGRAAAKSTIGETRAQRFLDVGRDDKRLPVYLNYFGAHTGRWSAGNKMNLQNLKRGGELRKSIIAPEGHVIVVADSAQIEARVTAWLADDRELLGLFAAGEDVYKYMAAQIYNKPVSEITKDERFIGKIAVLGLGYGMGAAKFQHTLATGAMGPAVDLPYDECVRIVQAYRNTRLKISELWNQMDRILTEMILKRKGEHSVLRWDEQYRIWLPNGLYLQYPGLSGDKYSKFSEEPLEKNEQGKVVYKGLSTKKTKEEVAFRNIFYRDYIGAVRARVLAATDDIDQEAEDQAHQDEEYVTDSSGKPKGKKIYGGLLTENVVQALARIIVGEQMLRISNNLKETSGAPIAGSPEARMVRRVVTMTHDEIVVCVPAEAGQATLDMMIEVMRTPPSWCDGIPLNAEGGFDVNYSK